MAERANGRTDNVWHITRALRPLVSKAKKVFTHPRVILRVYLHKPGVRDSLLWSPGVQGDEYGLVFPIYKIFCLWHTLQAYLIVHVSKVGEVWLNTLPYSLL